MDLTRRLRGKTVAEVQTNGGVLRIVTTDNAVLDIAWLTDGGQFRRGWPICVRHGVRVDARGFSDIANAGLALSDYPRSR